MTDAEFECLLQMSKNFVKYKVDLPQNNESSVFDLVGNVPTEKFFLDIDRRGKIELSKFKIQTRYATTKFPLVRIDIDSPPHLNPDGTKTSRNHIHIYKRRIDYTHFIKIWELWIPAISHGHIIWMNFTSLILLINASTLCIYSMRFANIAILTLTIYRAWFNESRC